jgi:hypothetical protein
VVLEKNSQIVFDRYTLLGGKMKLIVVPGKGHAEIAEYFQEQRLVPRSQAGSPRIAEEGPLISWECLDLKPFL